jgi:hypothetical protein
LHLSGMKTIRPVSKRSLLHRKVWADNTYYQILCLFSKFLTKILPVLKQAKWKYHWYRQKAELQVWLQEIRNTLPLRP